MLGAATVVVVAPLLAGDTHHAVLLVVPTAELRLSCADNAECRALRATMVGAPLAGDSSSHHAALLVLRAERDGLVAVDSTPAVVARFLGTIVLGAPLPDDRQQ